MEATMHNRMTGGGLDERLRARLEQRWAPLLEGITNPRIRRNTAILMENQACDAFGDSASATPVDRLMLLTEESRASAAGPYTKFIFPTVRRVYPELIANRIVSVQPMTSPVGAIFFFRYRYGTTKGSTAAGTEMVRPDTFDRNYASEAVSGEPVGAGDGATMTFDTILDFTPIRPITVSVSAGAVTASDPAGSGVLAGVGVAAGSTINYTTGAVHLVLAAPPAPGVALTAAYQYNSELNPLVPQVNFDVELIPVKADNWKLKAIWSGEAADDLRALHGQDAEVEIVAGMAGEMATEVDRFVITRVELAALTGGPGFGPSVGAFNVAPPAGVDEMTHLRNIIIPLNQVSYEIKRKTGRGVANWLITSPDVASKLDSLPFFTATDPGATALAGTIVKLGVLQGKWTVYVDPYFTKSRILMGYQGPDMLDTGAVFAPYVPIQFTQTFYDPADNSMRKGVRTRFAYKTVRPEFYGHVEVANLP